MVARVTASKVFAVSSASSPWDSPLGRGTSWPATCLDERQQRRRQGPQPTTLRRVPRMVARPEAEPIHHRNTGHVHPPGIGPLPPRTRTPTTTATTLHSWTRRRVLTRPLDRHRAALRVLRRVIPVNNSHAVPTQARTWLLFGQCCACRSASTSSSVTTPYHAGLIDECCTFYDTVSGRARAGTVRHGVRLRRDSHRASRHRPRRRGLSSHDLVTDFLADAAHEARTRHQGRHHSCQRWATPEFR